MPLLIWSKKSREGNHEAANHISEFQYAGRPLLEMQWHRAHHEEGRPLSRKA